jgi:hypothetical protein
MGNVHEKRAAVVARARVSATMASGTELWLVWAYIAIEQAGLAEACRDRIAIDVRGGRQPDLDLELYPAMVATTAAATSLDGFARLVTDDCHVQPQAPKVKEPTRAHWIWEALRAGFAVGSKTNTWPGQLKDLFILRNGQLHPKTSSTTRSSTLSCRGSRKCERSTRQRPPRTLSG